MIFGCQHKLLVLLLSLGVQLVGLSLKAGPLSGEPILSGPLLSEAPKAVSSAAGLGEACTLQLSIRGPIGAASVEFLGKGLERAQKLNCVSVLLLINTPGGLIASTRIMVEKILNSSVPVLCFVWPDGGHAGSAGSIILQACHVNGAMLATHMGAATPITATGAQMSEDARKKILNDTTSWLDSLTGLRNRNQQFGRDIITEAKSVPAAEAYKLGAIDFVGSSVQEFLDFASTREVSMLGGLLQQVQIGPLRDLQLSWREQLMAFLMNSEVAYLLFTGGMGLLVYELTHPGLMLPGVAGAVAFLVGAMSLHKLEARLGSMLLLLLGLLLLGAEAFVPSFGVLGLGGVVSFVLGGLFLFDPATGVQLPLSLVLTVSGVFASLAAVVVVLAVKGVYKKRTRRQASSFELVGQVGRVTSIDDEGRSGFMDVQGEKWRFVCDTPCLQDAQVLVQGKQGMVLKVKKDS